MSGLVKPVVKTKQTEDQHCKVDFKVEWALDATLCYITPVDW